MSKAGSGVRECSAGWDCLLKPDCAAGLHDVLLRVRSLDEGALLRCGCVPVSRLQGCCHGAPGGPGQGRGCRQL